jgi:hypothetical protein
MPVERRQMNKKSIEDFTILAKNILNLFCKINYDIKLKSLTNYL